MNESALVRNCIETLQEFGPTFRLNAGTFNRGGRKIVGLPRGCSDVLHVRPDGVCCFIECKAGNNTATPEQQKFLDRMRAAGARAGVAKNVTEAMLLCGY